MRSDTILWNMIPGASERQTGKMLSLSRTAPLWISIIQNDSGYPDKDAIQRLCKVMDRAQTLRVHYNLSYEFAYLYPSPLDQKAPLLESLELKQVGIPWGHDPEPLKLPDALFRNHAPRLAHLTLHRCRWPRQWASLPQLRSLTMA
jgi:hypothetical protein